MSEPNDQHANRPKWGRERTLRFLEAIHQHGTFSASENSMGQVGNWDAIVNAMGGEPGKDALQAKWSRIRRAVWNDFHPDKDDFEDQKALMAKFIDEWKRQNPVAAAAAATPAVPTPPPAPRAVTPLVMRTRRGVAAAAAQPAAAGPAATHSVAAPAAAKPVATRAAAAQPAAVRQARSIPRPEGGLVMEMEVRMRAMNGHEKAEFLASVVVAGRHSVEQATAEGEEDQPDVDDVLRGLLK